VEHRGTDRPPSAPEAGALGHADISLALLDVTS